MCLYTTWKKPRIAKRDIIVFKHLEKKIRNTYRTSYRKVIVSIGSKYSSKLDKVDEYNEVRKGLHSFHYKRDAVDEAIIFGEVVVRCVIPKGALYYKGYFDDMINYASTKLIYDKIIEDCTS